MMIRPEWIVRSAVSIVLLGCMSVASELSAQSTLGVTGLLNSPSAEMAADGTVRIPQVLRPYMGGKELLVPAKKSNL